MATPTPEMGVGPRTSAFSLTSLALQVELLLGNRPSYECMNEVKQAIQEIKENVRIKRNLLEQELEAVGENPEEPILETFGKLITLLQDWGRIAREEVGFLEACVHKLPDSPLLLYAIAPPPEALPRFYSVLYPAMTEPADAEEYVQLVQEFQAWRSQLEENRKAMTEMMQAQEGEGTSMMRDMFDNWAQHQVQLIALCNNLLQHHIVTQRLPAERQETSAMDIEVQWLAERLLKARIETRSQVFGSWLATAYWCTQLARSRLALDPHMAAFGKEGKVHHKRLHLFDKTKATEICKLDKPSKGATSLMEQQTRDRGEPYDDQRSQGLHPDHDADLMETLDAFKAAQEAEAAKKAAKALAQALAKGKGKAPR